MDIETRQAYSEVNRILELISEEMSNKIPLKLKNFFKREMDKNYIPTIDANIPIKEQNLKRKTIAIILGLNLQYWCKDEERKKELLKVYSNNEKKYQENLRKKYNPDDVFKKEKNNVEEVLQNNSNKIENDKSEKHNPNTQELQIQVVKMSFWKKIIKRISAFIKK